METHGIVHDDISRKLSESKVKRDWISAVFGLRSEQKIFDQIQQTFNPATCLLINGINQQDLFKVVKEKLQHDKKRIQLSDQESQFYNATNRHFEKIKELVKLWLEPLDEEIFRMRNRQVILDAMKIKGQDAKNKLISLLPTLKLKSKFSEKIESYMQGKCKEKTLSKEEWEHLLVRKLLRMTNPDSEFDILLFQKDTTTIYHLESKAIRIEIIEDESEDQFLKEYEKALYQLSKGKAWLEHIMKMMNMKPWNYVGYAAFPNIDNKVLELLGLSKEQEESFIREKRQEQIKILTKDEMDDPESQVWNDILGKTSNSPADGDTFNKLFMHKHLNITDASYKRLLALFVGSYYVTTLDEVMPRVTDEDLVKTRDNIGWCLIQGVTVYTA